MQYGHKPMSITLYSSGDIGNAFLAHEIVASDLKGSNVIAYVPDDGPAALETAKALACALNASGMAAVELLREAVDAWPQFDADTGADPETGEGADADVNGGDLVEWFAAWRERARASLGDASVPSPANPLQDAAGDMLAALNAVMRCARGEIERPATQRAPWPEAERLIGIALAKAEAAGVSPAAG